MTGRGPLVAVSATQLAAGVAGLVVAVRRRRCFDVWLPVPGVPERVRRGSPHHVLRDSVLAGTAYSAPVPMLVTQLVSVVRLARGPDPRAARALRILGGLMTAGYLAERSDRAHLQRWDPVETPVAATGVTLAAAMAVLGGRGSG